MSNCTYISHHGITGQKWGIRRYQYQDGSLTPEGKIRYGNGEHISIRERFRVKRKKTAQTTESSEEKKKRPEDMTDAELRAANERMKQILTYKDYTKKLEPKPVKTLPGKMKDAGKEYVSKCIKETSDKFAKDVLAPYLSQKVGEKLNMVPQKETKENKEKKKKNNDNNDNNE